MGCVPDISTNIHLADIGTRIVLEFVTFDPDTCKTTPVNVSAASVQDLLLEKPSGAVTVNTTVFDTDGVDGKTVYVTVINDIDEVGVWKAQGRITIPSGSFRSSIHTFQVDSNIA